MRIVNPIDQDTIAKSVEGAGRQLLDELPALTKGQAIICGGRRQYSSDVPNPAPYYPTWWRNVRCSKRMGQLAFCQRHEHRTQQQAVLARPESEEKTAKNSRYQDLIE